MNVRYADKIDVRCGTMRYTTMRYDTVRSKSQLSKIIFLLLCFIFYSSIQITHTKNGNDPALGHHPIAANGRTG